MCSPVSSGCAGATCFGSNKKVAPEKAVVANCSAVRELDANGTNFGYNPRTGQCRGEFGHNDYYPVALAAAQIARWDGRQTLLAMLSLDEIRGRLVLHQDGYGFVVPDVAIPNIDGDIFIPRDYVEDAMHGDQVIVRIVRMSGAPGARRAEGRIVRIAGRAHPTIVGLFRYSSRILRRRHWPE